VLQESLIPPDSDGFAAAKTARVAAVKMATWLNIVEGVNEMGSNDWQTTTASRSFISFAAQGREHKFCRSLTSLQHCAEYT